MGSPFLYDVVGNRQEVHRVQDEFLILLCSLSQEVPARARRREGRTSKGSKERSSQSERAMDDMELTMRMLRS